MAIEAFRENSYSVYVLKHKKLGCFDVVLDFFIDDLFFVFSEGGLWTVECFGECDCVCDCLGSCVSRSLIFNGLELDKFETKPI